MSCSDDSDCSSSGYHPACDNNGNFIWCMMCSEYSIDSDSAPCQEVTAYSGTPLLL